MKRYLAFFGDNYYPDGGMGDFLGDFNTLSEARRAIQKEIDEGTAEVPWDHVYDTVNKEIVYKK